MLDKLTSSMDLHTQALVLRSERQRVIAGNIANADTPGYAARESHFADALRAASGGSEGTFATGGLAAGAASGAGHARHIALGRAGGALAGAGSEPGYAVQTQPRLDGNSVDLDRERAAFADNAVRYEATLRFINGQGKTLLSAITGQ